MNGNNPTPAHLGLILHYMLVDIRNSSYSGDEHEWVNTLADYAENIPLQFINPDEFWLRSIEDSLSKLASIYPRANRYLRVLELTPEEVYRTLVPNHPIDWGADSSGVRTREEKQTTPELASK